MRFIAAINTRIYGRSYAQGAEIDTTGWTRKQMLQFLNLGLMQASQITAGMITDALVFTGAGVSVSTDAEGRLVVSIEEVEHDLDWLTDVDTAGKAHGDIIRWDEVELNWKAVALEVDSGAISLSGLADVDVSGLEDGWTLRWDEVDALWRAEPMTTTLGSLEDVDVTGIVDGQTVVWDQSEGKYVPGSPTGLPGPPGPVSWASPVPWTAGFVATVGPPASVVSYLGSSYVAIADSTGVVPTNTSYWRLVAAKGDKGDQGDVGPASTVPGPGVASGGTTGQFLKKNSNTSYDTSWASILQVPSGGTTGQVLTKGSGTNYSWTDAPSGLPTGGTTGQVLTKDSATDGDASWQTPSGGTVTAADVDSEAATDGQVLTADGAGGAVWADAAAGGGGIGIFRGAWSGPTYAPTGLTRTNAFTQPSFENNTISPFTAFTNPASIVTTPVRSGTYAAAVSGGNAGDSYIQITNPPMISRGTQYTISAYGWSTHGGTGGRVRKIVLFVWNGSGYNEYYSGEVPSGSWGRVSLTVTPPAGTGDILLRLYNGSASGSDVVYWDDIMIEVGPTLGSYFDGDTADAGLWAYDWSGTVRASASVATELELVAGPDYLVGDWVLHNGRHWVNTVAHNSATPGTSGSGWSEYQLVVDSADVPDLVEVVQDTVAAMIVEGSGLTKSYDDPGGQLTLSAAGGATGAAMETFSYNGALPASASGTQKLYNDSGSMRTLVKARASVVTAPSGGTVVVDVNVDAVSAFSTKPTIAAGGFTATATPSSPNWPDGSYLTIDIDSATAPAADLTVQVTYTQ